MKISLLDLFLCYVMRYKLTFLSVIISIILTIFFWKGSIIILVPVVMFFLFIEMWHNGNILFEYKSNKAGYIKRKMFNKYKDVLKFKCVLIYNQIDSKYRYINFDNSSYYICNIYLFIIKTYRQKKVLEYERKDLSLILFSTASKEEIDNCFYDFLTLKVRKINNNVMQLRKKEQIYSSIIGTLSQYSDD